MASSDLHLGLVKLGNPVPVPDLIKANASDDRRVKQLRQLLLSQLDLIHKQSEVIAAKDQQIKELKRENESLQQLINAKPAKVRKVEQPQKEEPEGQGILTENPYYTLQNYAVPATEEIGKFHKVYVKTTSSSKTAEKVFTTLFLLLSVQNVRHFIALLLCTGLCKALKVVSI